MKCFLTLHFRTCFFFLFCRNVQPMEAQSFNLKIVEFEEIKFSTVTFCFRFVLFALVLSAVKHILFATYRFTLNKNQTSGFLSVIKTTMP